MKFFTNHMFCGRQIILETDSKQTVRTDGVRFYYPDTNEKETSCLFRCDACNRVIKAEELRIIKELTE
jgi:uncharacterized SAM-dependent methyltransferase